MSEQECEHQWRTYSLRHRGNLLRARQPQSVDICDRCDELAENTALRTRLDEASGCLRDLANGGELTAGGRGWMKDWLRAYDALSAPESTEGGKADGA